MGLRESHRLVADIARQECDAKDAAGTVTWKDILMEEVFEALAEESPGRLMEELVQVAAVCAAWVEDIQSRGSGATLD